MSSSLTSRLLLTVKKDKADPITWSEFIPGAVTVSLPIFFGQLHPDLAADLWRNKLDSVDTQRFVCANLKSSFQWSKR